MTTKQPMPLHDTLGNIEYVWFNQAFTVTYEAPMDLPSITFIGLTGGRGCKVFRGYPTVADAYDALNRVTQQNFQPTDEEPKPLMAPLRYSELRSNQ